MRKLRRYYQIFFLALFFGLFYLASQGLLKDYQVTLFLDSSPLNGLGTVLSAGNLAYTMIIGFIVLALTFLLGRFFCSWICPLGTIFHWTSHLLRSRSTKQAIQRNEYVAFQTYKYILLIILLTCALFGSLQVGLFDPIALLTRSSATFLAPMASQGWDAIALGKVERSFPTAALMGAIFSGLLLLNAYRPRFWCRYICPLGALLGLAARFAPAGIVRDSEKCTNCGLCKRSCSGACSPDSKTRAAECLLCLNCLHDCPENALEWRWSADKRAGMERKFNLSRRQFVGATAGGVASFVSLRLGKTISGRGFSHRIRPPGALAERDFLDRCLKCGECIKVCPTNVLQPAIAEAGVEGFWTPILDMDRGYCELNCSLCGQVCPSGAIERLSSNCKIGTEDKRAVKMGTAFVDRSRCIPWSYGRECLVCQEVCPVSPKAIYTVRNRNDRVRKSASGEEVRAGEGVAFPSPQVDAERCIGCGLCQRECPVSDMPAIRVTSVGESRAPENDFIL